MLFSVHMYMCVLPPYVYVYVNVYAYANANVHVHVFHSCMHMCVDVFLHKDAVFVFLWCIYVSKWALHVSTFVVPRFRFPFFRFYVEEC